MITVALILAGVLAAIFLLRRALLRMAGRNTVQITYVAEPPAGRLRKPRKGDRL